MEPMYNKEVRLLIPLSACSTHTSAYAMSSCLISPVFTGKTANDFASKWVQKMSFTVERFRAMVVLASI